MNQEKIGILYGVGAYVMWGILPLYWKLIETIPPWEILAHRVLWSFVFMLFVVLIIRRWHIFIQELKNLLKHKKAFIGITVASIIISLNWGTYIWAVNTDRVLDASLGYYINPLISILFGYIFLKERFSKNQWVAIGLAFLGVIYLTVQSGVFPWAALFLAVTFALYGLIKKIVNLNAVNGLAIETLIVAPIALIYICYLTWQGDSSFSLSFDGLILFGAGAVTAIPLLLFAQGALRIPLSLIGFLQYIAPTLMLLFGVFLFNEPFTSAHVVTFILIWTGLILYSFERVKLLRHNQGENK